MADGTRLNPGEGGDLILTDEVGAFKVEVAKAAFGLDGELTLASSTNPLPTTDAAAVEELQAVIAALAETLGVEVVTEPATKADGGVGLPAVVKIIGGYDGTNTQALATDSSGILQADIANEPTVGVGGTALTRLTEIEEDTDNLAGIKTSVETLDNAIAGNEMQVDIVTAPALAAGSNKVGDVGISTRTSGGCSMNKNLDVDETEDAVKETTGQIYGFYFYNAATSVRYLKYYNATPANVTVGTTVPDLTFPLPKEAAGTINLPCPVAFGTAITIAATTGLADNNSGAPGANEVIVNTFYA